MSTQELPLCGNARSCDARPRAHESLSPGFLERIDGVLERALREITGPARWAAVRRHLLSCGELLTGALCDDCNDLDWRATAAACERAYTLGVAMGVLHLSLPRSAARPDLRHVPQTERDLRRRQQILRALLSTTASERGGSLGAAFPERAIRCLVAVCNDLEGATDGLSATSPILLLARIYEELLRAGNPTTQPAMREVYLRRLRLLTPVRVLAYARHGLERALA